MAVFRASMGVLFPNSHTPKTTDKTAIGTPAGNVKTAAGAPALRRSTGRAVQVTRNATRRESVLTVASDMNVPERVRVSMIAEVSSTETAGVR